MKYFLIKKTEQPDWIEIHFKNFFVFAFPDFQSEILGVNGIAYVQADEHNGYLLRVKHGLLYSHQEIKESLCKHFTELGFEEYL